MAALRAWCDRLARCVARVGAVPELHPQSPASTLRLVGLFLLVPPAVFFAVAIAIRRILRRG